ncbi:acyltransferase [Rugamonas sp.]|uniref:acyltransferase family protein n=1 Tax=Rugamonas sp. TaxID=1926287 RepID=UPI0025E7B897|nr:acyltransferase [Rugamonas sp.]
MTNFPTVRVHGLDTLRALAIVLVFMNHYMLFVSGEPTFGPIGVLGWTGVDLFFALSGYLIGNQIMASIRSEQGFSLKNFYARRLLRTVPNFYFMLALYALFPYVRGARVLPPLWQFLSFTQNILLTPGTAFSHAWSLCVEEQFYMLLPAAALLIAACRKSLLWAWLAIAACIIAGMLTRSYVWTTYVGEGDPGNHYYTLIYYSSLCRYDELMAGVALALLKNFHPAAWTRITSRGDAALAAGVATLGTMFYLFYQDRYGYAVTVFGYPMLGVAVALLLIAALSPGSLLQRVRVPGAASLALWSYAIYLSHKELCVLLSAQLKQFGIQPTTWAAVAIMSAATLLAGWLMFRFIETPFMKLRDRYVPHNYAAPGKRWAVA